LSEYEKCRSEEVPAGLVWVVPRRNQGQIVEVAYATGVPAGRSCNYDADEGDPWQRTTDSSDGSVTYARLRRTTMNVRKHNANEE
jgi:hypothetical protein